MSSGQRIAESNANAATLPEYCCLVLIFNSHGKEGSILDINGNCINLKNLFDIFHNKACKAMKGKPKLFFVDACRGGKKAISGNYI